MDRQTYHWTGAFMLLLLVVLLFGGCTSSCTSGPPAIHHVELHGEHGEHEVTIVQADGEQVMDVKDLRAYLNRAGYNRFQVERYARSARLQQKAYRQAKRQRAQEKDSLHEEALYMARAVYSEVGQNEADAEYIAWVIRNRIESKDYPGDARSVILQHKQFSAFNSPEKRSMLMELDYDGEAPTDFRRYYRMSLYVLKADRSVNPMPEVTHFYMGETLRTVYGKDQPRWAEGKRPFYTSGQTRYYRDVEAPHFSDSS